MFRYYSWLILAVLTLTYAFSLGYYAQEQVRQVMQLQSNLCSSIGNSINASADRMSIVSMNILYSRDIRESLRKADTDRLNVSSMGPVYNMIASIIGPYGTVTQVDIHSMRNFVVGWGNYELCKPETYQQITGYSKIKERDGAKYFGVPVYRNDLAYYNRYLKDKKFISLYRIFFDDSFKEEGIAEVIQDCDVFFSDLNDLEANNPDRTIYILNENQEIIYPYNESVQKLPEKIQENFPENVDEVKHLFGVGGKFASCMKMKDSGWMIVTTQSWYQAFQPLIFVLLAYLIIGIVSILISVAACYRISNTVTEPLNQLKHNIEQIDMNNLMDKGNAFSAVNAHTLEIEMLSDVFQKMYTELGESAQKLFAAKEEELRAKMIATQSMINPHFIFNNLANISVMAEENMNEEIVALCKNLCDYLRYIAADSMTTVDVKTEIFYTKKYLECIKVRYGKRLKWYIDVPPELESIPISKLSLQPIVENAQKYAFRTKPVWKIWITGAVTENFWELSVSDNGIGIKEEYLREIYDNFDRIRETKDISKMKIGGMGLANVYLRLILLHGDETQLLVQNRAEGGVTVTLKGKNTAGQNFLDGQERRKTDVRTI